MGRTWEDYQQFKAARQDSASSQASLDSDRVRRVTSLVRDPARHAVTNWIQGAGKPDSLTVRSLCTDSVYVNARACTCYYLR